MFLHRHHGLCLFSAKAETANLQPLHILWALTSNGESAVGKLLHAQGITVEQVEGAIQKPDT